jgi:hypothetical protein
LFGRRIHFLELVRDGAHSAFDRADDHIDPGREPRGQFVGVTRGAGLQALRRRLVGHVKCRGVDRHGHRQYPEQQPAANRAKSFHASQSLHASA